MYVECHRRRDLTRKAARCRVRPCIDLRWALLAQSVSVWFCGEAERPISQSYEQDMNESVPIAFRSEAVRAFTGRSQRGTNGKSDSLLQVDTPRHMREHVDEDPAYYLQAGLDPIKRWYDELQKRTDLNYRTQGQYHETQAAVAHMLDQFQFKAWRLHNNMTRWLNEGVDNGGNRKTGEKGRMQAFNEDAFAKVLENYKDYAQWKQSKEGQEADDVVKAWNSNNTAFTSPAGPLPAQSVSNPQEFKASLDHEGSLPDGLLPH